MAGIGAALLLGGASGASDGKREAETLAHLFAVTCLDHAGNTEALRAALARRPFRPMPAVRAEPLLRRPGQAFEVAGDPGRAVLLSFDDGWCGAGAGGVDPRTLTVALSAAVRDRNGAMQLMDAGNDGAEQHYMIERGGGSPPMVLLVLMHGGEDAVQATLFADVMPKEGGTENGGTPR